MNGQQLLKIVEQYCRKQEVQDEEFTVTRIANWKTVFVEQNGENNGRAIMLTEFKVDGTKCWAGYSDRSQTVYISLTN
jgi:hypothetical protein